MASYPESETETTKARDESYPKGRSGGVTGSLSLRLPGKGNITTGRGAKRAARSAAGCADSMGPASGSDVIKL